MKNKEEAISYTVSLFNDLNSIILKWNPYGLAGNGEIDDEFSDEVWLLLQKLSGVTTEDEVTQSVVDVFLRSFNKKEFDFAACRSVGSEIFQWWVSKV